MSEPLPRVAVAGASGFVGSALVGVLARRAEVIALGRRVSEGGGAEASGVSARRCDLFSLRETEAALKGADVAFYLVHSMLPSTRLTQASFEDLDLLLADNFGRAAAQAGVKRIIYLGGLVPPDGESGAELSAHLRSRLEAEHALGAHGVPVTAVRAGLIVGAGGSSLQILARLVRRLPMMLCPRWTGSRSQPIALEDVVSILVHCLEDPETTGRICEVGGPDILTYRDMMRETARVMGRRRLLFPVPFFTPGLSRLWVSLITRAPRKLVAPLIQSLRHPMVAQDRWLQERMGLPGRPFAESLAEAVRSEGLRREPTVRSVQRLPRPAAHDARWVAEEYIRWLPRFLSPLLRVEQDGNTIRIFARMWPRPLLELSYRAPGSEPDRAVLDVTGGELAGPRIGTPRLEFRVTPDGGEVLAALQDFRPGLPWWIYAFSQAPLHRLIMVRFGRHLARSA